MTKSTNANREKFHFDLLDSGDLFTNHGSYDPVVDERNLALLCLLGTTEPVDFSGQDLQFFDGSTWRSLFDSDEQRNSGWCEWELVPLSFRWPSGPRSSFVDGEIDEESTGTSPSVPLRRDSHHGVKP